MADEPGALEVVGSNPTDPINVVPTALEFERVHARALIQGISACSAGCVKLLGINTPIWYYASIIVAFLALAAAKNFPL